MNPLAGPENLKSNFLRGGGNVALMNANRAIKIAAQRTQGLWGAIFVCFGGENMTLGTR